MAAGQIKALRFFWRAALACDSSHCLDVTRQNVNKGRVEWTSRVGSFMASTAPNPVADNLSDVRCLTSSRCSISMILNTSILYSILYRTRPGHG